MGETEAEEGPMTDQELIITALRQSGVIIAEHLEPGNKIDADETIAQLIAILDRQDLAAAHGPAEKRARIAGGEMKPGRSQPSLRFSADVLPLLGTSS